ncbi:hypothetical protein AKJ08_2097 [Vulgatibacter incomptus]|uniref:Uncharacterized protein n=1 Tax=Vulgatibacter incomptus TaxID=1391653 RepID=A0A0K1PDX6_9BACT|nr:hypothetical protein AKJ08_2097 [Vulgatibacter incomptus]
MMSVPGDVYVGDPAFTQRATRTRSFLLPPVRFFAFPADATVWAAAPVSAVPPYLPPTTSPGYAPQIVGLRRDTTSSATLLTPSFADDLRYVLDVNRIRAVSVAFKVVEPRNDPNFSGGVDLGGSRPGTARVSLMESSFELKALSSFLQ